MLSLSVYKLYTFLILLYPKRIKSIVITSAESNYYYYYYYLFQITYLVIAFVQNKLMDGVEIGNGFCTYG